MSFFDVTRIGQAGAVRTGAADDMRAAREAAGRADTGRAARPDTAVEVQASGVIDTGTPPVDAERVAEIREALRDGRYPIVPAKIADAMIAAKLMLSASQ